MGNDSISDVDREVIGRIARASLRHEEKVPGTVVARSSLRGEGQGNKRDSGCHAEQRILHYHISEALLALPRIYGREGASACSKLLESFAIAVTHSCQSTSVTATRASIKNLKRLSELAGDS
jgi:hypothetical protein